jgi:hypothetical protein
VARTATSRPAETGGIAGALAVLIAHAFGLNDPDVIVALIVVIGAIPTLITAIVAYRHGADAPAREIRAANQEKKP